MQEGEGVPATVLEGVPATVPEVGLERVGVVDQANNTFVNPANTTTLPPQTIITLNSLREAIRHNGFDSPEGNMLIRRGGYPYSPDNEFIKIPFEYRPNDSDDGENYRHSMQRDKELVRTLLDDKLKGSLIQGAIIGKGTDHPPYQFNVFIKVSEINEMQGGIEKVYGTITERGEFETLNSDETPTSDMPDKVAIAIASLGMIAVGGIAFIYILGVVSNFGLFLLFASLVVCGLIAAFSAITYLMGVDNDKTRSIKLNSRLAIISLVGLIASMCIGILIPQVMASMVSGMNMLGAKELLASLPMAMYHIMHFAMIGSGIAAIFGGVSKQRKGKSPSLNYFAGLAFLSAGLITFFDHIIPIIPRETFGLVIQATAFTVLPVWPVLTIMGVMALIAIGIYYYSIGKYDKKPDKPYFTRKSGSIEEQNQKLLTTYDDILAKYDNADRVHIPHQRGQRNQDIVPDGYPLPLNSSAALQGHELHVPNMGVAEKMGGTTPAPIVPPGQAQLDMTQMPQSPPRIQRQTTLPPTVLDGPNQEVVQPPETEVSPEVVPAR